jgi:hypothetical protein
MKNIALGLVCAVGVVGGLRLLEASSNQQGRESHPASGPTLCLDEAGLRYSKNALRKVNGQIQRCDDGNRWLASSPDFTRDEETAAAAMGKKDCIGTHKEAYESGLYRQVEKSFERCDDGTWIPEGK